MTPEAEEQTSPAPSKTVALCPIAVVIAALVVYGLTMSHWVTLRSLQWVAPIAGWDWHPGWLDWRPIYFAPVWRIVTWPFGLLPASIQPLLLNAFAVVCAALTLGLLVRCVRLLPHDRTREQRMREPGENALLSGPMAWAPQLLAALMLGFDLTFWENATVAGNEMLDLLIFAWLVYSVLSYRVHQDDRKLSWMALVYGIGVANSYALIGFFPLFVIALIMIKGKSFFTGPFLGRMIGMGALGLLVLLVVPALGAGDKTGGGFGNLLHQELGEEYGMLRRAPLWLVLVAGLSSLLPLLFASLRWPGFEGELSAAGAALTKFMFILMNVLFLPVALFGFFDYPYSPNPRVHFAPTPYSSFLTFYFLGALAAGYFCGYTLVVFSKRPMSTWNRPGGLGAMDYLALGVMALLAVGAPCVLLWQTFPLVHAESNDSLAQYTRQLAGALPERTAIVMSDDPNQTELFEAGYSRLGKTNPHIMLDTTWMTHGEYFRYLAAKHPDLVKEMVPLDKLPELVDSQSLAAFLYQLGHKYEIYYLHPSFGYYFEKFYQRAHGPVYALEPYATSSFLTPPPGAQDLKVNDGFWQSVKKESFDSLVDWAPHSQDAGYVSAQYSVELDFWGVELQRADHLKEAHDYFSEAMRLNTNNYMAKMNDEYNKQLQRGDNRPLRVDDTVKAAFEMYRTPDNLYRYNGPPDEPDLDLIFGQRLASGGNSRQAAALFARRLQLLPGDLNGELALAKCLVDMRQPESALEILRAIRRQTNTPPQEVNRVESVAYLAKDDFATAEKILIDAYRASPNAPDCMANLVEFYRRTGLEARAKGDKALATRRLTLAMSYVDKVLDPAFAKITGVKINITEALSIKADLQMNLGQYDAAVASLTQLLQIDPENGSALLNRATVEAQEKKFDAAKDDLETLRQALPEQAYIAYYGLQQVAQAEKDVDSQKRYLRLFLQSAPPASPEYARMKELLRTLEGR